MISPINNGSSASDPFQRDAVCSGRPHSARNGVRKAISRTDANQFELRNKRNFRHPDIQRLIGKNILPRSLHRFQQLLGANSLRSTSAPTYQSTERRERETPIRRSRDVLTAKSAASVPAPMTLAPPTLRAIWVVNRCPTIGGQGRIAERERAPSNGTRGMIPRSPGKCDAYRPVVRAHRLLA